MGQRMDLYNRGAVMKDTKEHILNLFRESGLGKYENELEKYIKPSIRLQTVPSTDENITIGASKLGGNPDLPYFLMWPMWNEYHMSFIGQLNLNTLNKEVLEYYSLPHNGMLSFFCTAHPDVLYDEDAFYGYNEAAKIFYFDESEKLTRVAFPLEKQQDIWFNPCIVEGSVEWTVPGPESYEISKGLGIGWTNNRDDFDTYRDKFMKKFRENFLKDRQPQHRFLGNHDPVQSGFIDGSYNMFLQIDSDDHTGMMWGDVGIIYFCIQYEQLKQMNFNHAYVLMECS